MLYLNGTIFLNQTWDGSDIVLELYNLSKGWYNYTLLLVDKCGNSVQDEVIVIVTQPSSITETETPTSTYTTNTSPFVNPFITVFIIAGGMVALILVFCKDRRNQ